MASTIKPVVPQAATSPDSSQRISTKTRIGVASVIGGAAALGAGAAAAYFLGGSSAIVAKVGGFVQQFVKEVPSLQGAPYGLNHLAGHGTLIALGGTAVITGAGVGAVTGKVTAHRVSLNDVKGSLGAAGSDLNFGQMHRIANIAVQGGIFTGRSATVQFKDDAVRIHNLNTELTNTERSLSSNAHNTSKARGTEDRFFDIEGARLAANSGSSASFVETINSLKAAVHAEVKATDKYTYQQGNSSTAVSRREYILAGIMGFAHSRGIAGSFLTAAVNERMELARTNPKQADAEFRQAIQKGIASGILAPGSDSKSYEGMVQAAAAATKASNGKNPDSIISSIFDAFKEAGLIDGNLRARFIKDVHARASNPEAKVVNPTPVAVSPGQSPGLLRDINSSKDATSADAKAQADAEIALEEGLSNPVVAKQAKQSGKSSEKALLKQEQAQEKALLKQAAEDRANEEVGVYSDSLGRIDPRQKQLADLYQKLIDLLTEKKIPLDQIMEMGPRRLRGVLTMRHKEDFDLFAQYEANDPAISSTREQIASLTEALDSERRARPEDFKRASKGQRKAAESLEKQIKAGDALIANLKAKAAGVDGKIQAIEETLGDNESRASTFLFPATEDVLPEPKKPSQPGFFEKLFSSHKKAIEPQSEVEEALIGEVDVEEVLSEPVVAKKATPAKAAVVAETVAQVEDTLPEPVIEKAKPRWKIWA